jgi:hypothetical protein
MDEKKSTLGKEVEDTMACSAYAEAGEPCPIDDEGKKAETGAGAEKAEATKKSSVKSVSDTMACSAYAEAGEPCPIDDEGKKAEAGTKE